MKRVFSRRTRTKRYHHLVKCGWFSAVLFSLPFVFLSPARLLITEEIYHAAKIPGSILVAEAPLQRVETPVLSRSANLKLHSEVKRRTEHARNKRQLPSDPTVLPTASIQKPAKMPLLQNEKDSFSNALIHGRLPMHFVPETIDAHGKVTRTTETKAAKQAFSAQQYPAKPIVLATSMVQHPNEERTYSLLDTNELPSAPRTAVTTTSLTAGLVSGPVMPDTPLEDYSSVDYVACCGLGHRLARMSDAYHIAKGLRFELRTFWRWCKGKNKTGQSSNVEIYSGLFDPPSKHELSYVNSTHQRVSLSNHIYGYTEAIYHTNGTGCGCHGDKIATDVEFYTSLRNRFKRRDDVNDFVQKHFVGKLSLGIHVRAGNGEAGDFEFKKRRIADVDLWVENVAANIRNLVKNRISQNLTSAVLFIATDTPSYIDRFRAALADIMPVVIWEQDRAPEGAGVFFGEGGYAQRTLIHTDHNECLTRWEDTVIDQMLLSHTDVLITGMRSSFTQTLPLSLAFGRTERKVETPFCEVRGDQGDALDCFKSYLHWCCNDTTGQTKDTQTMVRFMYPGRDRRRIDVKMREDYKVMRCLPYDYDDPLPINYCLPHDFEATRPFK